MDHRLHKIFRASLALTVLAGSAFAYSDVLPDAGKQITRLDPAVAFPELPKNVIAALKTIDCKIPQIYGGGKPQNVIRGSFAAKGQMDWAVLCSTQGVSKIEIYWGGSARCSSEIAPIDDKVVASRAINPLAPKLMQGVNRMNEGTIPSPISHEGIDDAYDEKASVIHYCNAGKWIELSGSD